MSAGYECKAKATLGSWIVLTEWAEVDRKATPIRVVAKQVDGKEIKADTWYAIKDGAFVETEV